jgi:DNA-binding NarL/FixJ family response regulator
MTDAATGSSDEIWPGYTRRRHASVMRVVVIDEDRAMRDAVCSALSIESDLCTIGSAGSIEEGIALVQRWLPELVICGYPVSRNAGVRCVERLCRESAQGRVVMMVAGDSLEIMRSCFSAGAAGCVRKDALRVDLLLALRRVAAGGHGVCRGGVEMVIQDWLLESEPPAQTSGARLSPEDRQILRLIALGVPTWKIATELGRSVKVVEKQRAALMRRLNLAGVQAVAQYALQGGLVTHDEIDRLFASD